MVQLQTSHTLMASQSVLWCDDYNRRECVCCMEVIASSMEMFGKQPSDIICLYLIVAGRGLVMPSTCVDLWLQLWHSSHQHVCHDSSGCITCCKKTSEAATSQKRKRCHLCCTKQDRKCLMNCHVCHQPWVSSFLTAHRHIIGYSVPWRGREWIE